MGEKRFCNDKRNSMNSAKRVLITNACVVTPSRVYENHEVIVANAKIERIQEVGAGCCFLADENVEVHDLDGAFLMPGIIDIHSDAIETILQPRPTSVMDLDIAFLEQEKQLLNQGITTMYHSLSLMQEGALRDKEARKPQLMNRIVEKISEHNRRRHLIRHKFHCRFDIRNIAGFETLMNYIADDRVHLLSFNDHTPGQGQYRDLDRYRKTMKKYYPTYSDNDIDVMIEKKMAYPAIGPEKVSRIAEFARIKGIPIASHDDDSEDKLAYVQDELSVEISEFPVELAVARKAKQRGMLTVAGAPNVLLGRSQSGNVSATEAILDGCCDILCSDYFPPSMLHAVFKLNREHNIPLADAINLVTFNPARALGIEKEFGQIAPGCQADLVAVDTAEGYPVITRVFIDGILVSALNYRMPVTV